MPGFLLRRERRIDEVSPQRGLANAMKGRIVALYIWVGAAEREKWIIIDESTKDMHAQQTWQCF